MRASYIALVMGSFRAGGAERAIVRLANALHAKGEQVCVIVLNAEGPFMEELDPGVQLFVAGKKRSRFALTAILALLRKYPIRAAVVSQTHVQLIFMLAKLWSGKKFPVVLNEHSPLGKNLAGGSLNNWLLKKSARPMFASADGITAVSQGVRDSILQDQPELSEKVQVIFNPVLDDKMESLKAQEIHHSFFKEQGVKAILLSAGRLMPSKRLDLLISAFGRLPDYQQYRLILLGEGAERKKLESLIHELNLQKYISMPGFVSNPYAWMSRADVFVMSSDYEGLPLSLIEALACGCKVVSTDCPSGPAEILEQGNLGTLVAPGSADALATGILAALESRSELKLRPQQLSRYEAGRIAEQYLELILQLEKGN